MSKKCLLFLVKFICLSLSLYLRNNIKKANIVGNKTNVITYKNNNEGYKTSFIFDGEYNIDKICKNTNCELTTYELYCEAHSLDYGNCTYFAGNFNFVFLAENYAYKYCSNGTIIKNGIYNDYVCTETSNLNYNTVGEVVILLLVFSVVGCVYLVWKNQ